MRAQRKMLLTDTCHSGEVDEAGATLVAARTVGGVNARAVSTRGLKKRPRAQADGMEADRDVGAFEPLVRGCEARRW